MRYCTSAPASATAHVRVHSYICYSIYENLLLEKRQFRFWFGWFFCVFVTAHRVVKFTRGAKFCSIAQAIITVMHSVNVCIYSNHNTTCYTNCHIYIYTCNEIFDTYTTILKNVIKFEKNKSRTRITRFCSLISSKNRPLRFIGVNHPANLQRIS